jgi:uncharacterized protein (TIGR02270 family)
MQHVQDAAHLRGVRSVIVRAGHVRLLHLARLDERIAAHLDGVAVAGAYGKRVADQALGRAGAGEIFVATVHAIESRDADRLDRLVAIADAAPPARAGLLSAFGWVNAADLKGVSELLFQATSPWRREVLLVAHGMSALDPTVPVRDALRDNDPSVRVRALRIAGRCGRRDLVEDCLPLLTDANERCAFEAARAALLLGDRAESLLSLEAIAVGTGGDRAPDVSALREALKVVSPKRARAMLASLAKHSAHVRIVIHGIATAGDPHYIPWLIAQMEDVRLARLAGEAFTFITGLDLAFLDLDRKPPDGVAFGPNDEPNDATVSLDEDENLPWPDPSKLDGWWKKNGARFRAGTRYFMGHEPTPQHCLEVLKSGFQRQRMAASMYRSLLAPGTPLFNVAAPSWRQQRLLSRMSP